MKTVKRQSWEVKKVVVAFFVGFVFNAMCQEPVVHWTLDGVVTNSGTGGDTYDGTLSGAVIFTNGISGQGARLPGGDADWISLPYTFTDQGTIALWYNPEAFYDHNTVFDNSSDPNQWEMWIYASGNLSFWVNYNHDNRVNYDLNSGANGTNHWYHLAITWDRYAETNQAHMYINGVEVSKRNISPWSNPGDTIYFGGHPGNGRGRGILDDVRIYDSTLTAEQIQAIHTEIAEQAPVVHVALDDSVDNIGTGGTKYDAVLTGDPAWTNGWNNKGEALVLDGVDDYLSVPYRLSFSGSIAFWYYVPGPWYNYNSLFDNSVDPNHHECWIDVNGWLHYRPASWQSQAVYNMGSSSNRWYHIVCTWDAVATNTVLYVNGVEKGRAVNATGNMWPIAGSNFYIGGGNAGNTPARGYVSDLQIFETPLSSNRVAEVYSEFSQRGGLVAYLPLDGSAVDVAGSNTVVVSGSPSYVKAQVINGLAYDPAEIPGAGGACVSVSNVLGSSVGTIAMWYYARGPWYNYQPVMDNSLYREYWESWIYGDGRFAIRISNLTGGGIVTYDLDNLRGSNSWYHIAFTWDREDQHTRLYIDGVLRSTASLTDAGWVDPDPTLRIGSFWSENRAANGIWDEVRVYDRALSADEIEELTVIPPPPPPTGTVILLH